MAFTPMTQMKKKSLAQLQSLCAHTGLPAGGNKSDITARLLKHAVDVNGLAGKSKEELETICAKHEIRTGGKENMRNALANHFAIMGGPAKRKVPSRSSAKKGSSETSKYYVVVGSDTADVTNNRKDAYKKAQETDCSVVTFDDQSEADNFAREHTVKSGNDEDDASDSNDDSEEEAEKKRPRRGSAKGSTAERKATVAKSAVVVTPPRAKGNTGKMKAQLKKRIATTSKDQFRIKAKKFAGTNKVLVVLDMTTKQKDGRIANYWAYKGQNLKHVFNMTSEDGSSFVPLKFGDTADFCEVRAEPHGTNEHRQVSVIRKGRNGEEATNIYKDYANTFIVTKPDSQSLKSCAVGFAEKIKKFLAQADIPEFYSMALYEMYGEESKIAKQLKNPGHLFWTFVKNAPVNYAELESLDEYLSDEFIAELIQDEDFGGEYLRGPVDECPLDVAAFYYKDGSFPSDISALFSDN